jgi:hypothetical protein
MGKLKNVVARFQSWRRCLSRGHGILGLLDAQKLEVGGPLSHRAVPQKDAPPIVPFRRLLVPCIPHDRAPAAEQSALKYRSTRLVVMR